MKQTPKEGLFTELFYRRPVESGIIIGALGAFQKEVVELAFYWMCLGKTDEYKMIVREVLKGFPLLAQELVSRVPIYGTWGYLWELYGISEAGDKAIDSLVLVQFSEDQELEKPSQFVKWLPVDFRKPLTKRFAGLLFPLTKDSERIRRYRKAVSCLKRFSAAAVNVPERRIISEGESAFADTILKNILQPLELINNVGYINAVKLSHNILCMCDYSESMSGKPMKISLALGIISGRIITFDKQPEWHVFRAEDSIQKKIISTRDISQVSQVDFNIAYQLILKGVVSGKISLAKYLLVVTDMDYKDACACVFDVKGVHESFAEAGYQAPLLIIWNVSRAFCGDYAVLYEEGVAQMHGWSDSMWKMLESGVRIITPIELVREELAGQCIS